MPNPNAIVDVVKSVTRPVPPASAARVGVTLANGTTLTLDPADRRSAAIADFLEALAKAGKLVYLERDASGTTRRLILPAQFRVEFVAAKPLHGRFAVRHHPSSAGNYVRAANPDAGALLKELRAVERQDQSVLVTQDEAEPEIIDVRAVPVPLRALALSAAGPPPYAHCP